MKTLTSIDQLSSLPGPLVLAIGVFDGVHLGHRAVIARALADAREIAGTAVLVTFDPHPARILRPEAGPLLLTCTRHKQLIIAELGVEHLLVIPFDWAFAATPAEDFIRRLAGAARPLSRICVGENWAFGKGRSGNLALMQTLGAELGFTAVGQPDVAVDGQPVSSTVIRSAVQTGDLASAARMLGRDFSILGTVVEGRKLGRELGFPTANLRSFNEQLPPDGVYAVTVSLPLPQGLAHGVANIGVRPTVSGEGERQCEVHLFDFTGDLYGAELEVSFHRFLRTERKFTSLEALQSQIAMDVVMAKGVA